MTVQSLSQNDFLENDTIDYILLLDSVNVRSVRRINMGMCSINNYCHSGKLRHRDVRNEVENGVSEVKYYDFDANLDMWSISAIDTTFYIEGKRVYYEVIFQIPELKDVEVRVYHSESKNLNIERWKNQDGEDFMYRNEFNKQGEIVSLFDSTPNGLHEIKYSYSRNSKKLKKIIELENHKKIKEYLFFYDCSGRLKKITHWNNQSKCVVICNVIRIDEKTIHLKVASKRALLKIRISSGINLKDPDDWCDLYDIVFQR